MYDAGSKVNPVVMAVGFCRGIPYTSFRIVVRNNKKRQPAMFKHSKIRQAGLILIATTLLLILPNLSKVIG